MNSATHAEADPELERLIELLSTRHELDIRGYKRSTLYRRIRKRLSDSGAGSVSEYVRLLEKRPEEYARLISTILINVTEFFRDPEAWEYLQACLQPRVAGWSGEPIRVWSLGCSTGEEPYSTAILLAELLTPEQFRAVKIYATDIDEASLSVARTAVYGPETLRNVDAERLRRFFHPLSGSRYAVNPEIRAAVVFGRHNALGDPPISRLHLLVCRNLLIYFDSATQRQILTRLHYGIRNDGYLFLGKAETLMTRSALFQAVEPRFRIFQKLPGGLLPAGTGGAAADGPPAPPR